MRNFLVRYQGRTLAVVGAAAGGVALAISPELAFAALDETALDAAVAGVTTDAELAFSKAFPILATVVGLVVGMALFKKFIMKGAS